jgi:hypothetical protein
VQLPTDGRGSSHVERQPRVVARQLQWRLRRVAFPARMAALVITQKEGGPRSDSIRTGVKVLPHKCIEARLEHAVPLLD